MYFISTRGEEKVTGAQAISQCLAKDGGLFVPEVFPKITSVELEKMSEMNYPERVAFVLSKYLGELSKEFLLDACKRLTRILKATTLFRSVALTRGCIFLNFIMGLLARLRIFRLRSCLILWRAV